jgi:uncharacterized damage-inducible protein DinB
MSEDRVHRMETIERAAGHLEAANREVMAFLASLGPDRWEATGTEEGWPVRGVAYHVADGYRIHLRWLDLLRRQEAVPGTPLGLDRENAQAVADAASLSPPVILAALQTAGRLLVAYLRGLDPVELDRSARHGQLGGRQVSVRDMLGIAPWHVRSHLLSMRQAAP